MVDGARRDRIVIVDSDPAWATQFEAQRGPLERALAARLCRPIEHIGSTAVPGLPAKPIIDMVAVVPDIEDVAGATGALQQVGWVPAPEPHDVADRRRSWCFPNIAHRSHHLHIVEERSPLWPTWLAFRDHLRVHPADRERYGALKRSLAAADDTDRPRYRAAKAPLIREILQRALPGHDGDTPGTEPSSDRRSTTSR